MLHQEKQRKNGVLFPIFSLLWLLSSSSYCSLEHGDDHRIRMKKETIKCLLHFFYAQGRKRKMTAGAVCAPRGERSRTGLLLLDLRGAKGRQLVLPAPRAAEKMYRLPPARLGRDFNALLLPQIILCQIQQQLCPGSPAVASAVYIGVMIYFVISKPCIHLCNRR